MDALAFTLSNELSISTFWVVVIENLISLIIWKSPRPPFSLREVSSAHSSSVACSNACKNELARILG